MRNSNDTHWDPDRYLRHEDARLRPALDLLGQVRLEDPARVLDLGCGTGNLTRILARRWPAAHIVGLDSSAAMLEKARASDGDEDSSIEWREEDIGQLSLAEPADLLYSNAALHWLEDHARLFPRLVESLAPGGVLAVQMPLSHDLASHVAMRDILAEPADDGEPIGDAELRSRMARRPVESAAFYYRLLRGLTASIDIWSTEYLQVLVGEDPVLDWVSSTGLRPVLRGLPTARRDLFLERYRARLREHYRPEADGRVLFPFRRLFLVATR